MKAAPRKPRKRAQPKAITDRATEYALAVVEGREVAGPWVRKACRRHLDDIANGAARGLVWRPDESERVIGFYPAVLTLEGGAPFVLQPFQAFIVGSLFGWYTTAGNRRFRTAYVETAKGSGKTPLAAGIGVYALVADGEPSPEVYSAAATADQAGIAWRDAKRMVQACPDLAAAVEVLAHALTTKDGVFRPVSSEHKGLDGKRVHVAIVDELHEHPNAMVVDKMRAGLKARRNGLIFEITNSGDDFESVCFHHRELSCNILDGVVENDSWFAYVCALDDGDDWRDESVWLKANPGLGTILPWQYMREQVQEAAGMPSKEGIVKRLNLCIWTQQHTVWIPMDKWNALSVEPDVPPGWEAVACGVDLSSKLDLTAVAVAFRYRDERPATEIEIKGTTLSPEIEPETVRLSVDFRVHVRLYFYRPADTIIEAAKRDGVPYDLWAEQKWIRATPGNVVDYDEILRDMVGEIDGAYALKSGEVGYDPYNGTQFAGALVGHGFRCVEIPQNVRNISEPAKLFEALVVDDRITWDGNPCLAWCVSNVAAKEDRNGNLFPFKPSARKRIDGVAATINALSRLITLVPSAGESVYEQRFRSGQELVTCV